MAVDISILDRMTDIDSNVKQMVLALPDFRVGDKVHQIYVNKLEGATPGRHSEFLRTGARFIDIFFPNWQPIDFTADVCRLTGLDDGWWSNFAVAVLCQSMDNLTHDLNSQLKHSDINNTVTSNNATLNSRTTQFYSYVFSKVFSDFSAPFNSIDHNTAKEQYKQVLKDGVEIHTLWYAEGLWKNPDWEMYHHYIKLIALGASNTEIDELIDELKAAGLPVASDIDKGNWSSFTGFFYNNPQVNHSDIDSKASDGILRSEYIAAGEYGSYMKEENSFEFTANSQPGNIYRQAPSSGSCFSQGTKVLMYDLSLKPIETVESGDLVASPTGTREVAFVSAPLRRGRTLYSFNGLPFRFTESHPFINGDRSYDNPQLLSVSPKELTAWVPTLSGSGVAKLEPGAKVICIQASNPAQTEVKTVETLDRHKTDDLSDEILYDLILKPDSSETFEYIVGTNDDLFLVASEIPLIFKAPYTTYTILEMLSESLPALNQKFKSTDRKAFYDQINWLRRSLSAELLYRSLSKINMLNPAEISLDSIESYVSKQMQSFVTPEQEYNWIAGGSYEMLAATLGEEIEAAIALGWRSFAETEGDNMAISLADLHLDYLHPVSVDSCLRLVVKLVVGSQENEVQTIFDSQGRENTRFVRCFDRVLYFNSKFANAKTPKKLIFDFFLDDGEKPLFTATAYLPHQLQPNYHRFSPRIHTVNEEICGHLFFDVRFLSLETIEREKLRSVSWNKELKLCLAQLLGRQMGTVLSETIAAIKINCDRYQSI